MSRAQIDRLGDRIRKGDPTPEDVRFLDEYRRSFGEPYQLVVRTIREHLQLEPTGRPAKSTLSLVEKLRRESIRLSQMQDIAGCRVVVAGVPEQNGVVASLRQLFPGAAVVDRRTTPSYGYRAVHVVPEILGRRIEVQVRSALQHVWAELSEKLSDVVNPAIKYGGGEPEVQQMLTKASRLVAVIEDFEKEIADFEGRVKEQVLENARQKVTLRKREAVDLFRATIATLANTEEHQ